MAMMAMRLTALDCCYYSLVLLRVAFKSRSVAMRIVANNGAA
jgi:hypothetical protein